MARIPPMAWHYLCSGNFGIGFLVCLAVDSTCAKGWHAKGYQPIGKSPGPMEQSTILLLGFHLESIKIYQSHTVIPDEHSRLAKKVKNGKRPTRMKSAEGSLFRQISQKMTWNIVTQRCTKIIKHRACAVKWASLKCHSFRSQTLSPARYQRPITRGWLTTVIPWDDSPFFGCRVADVQDLQTMTRTSNWYTAHRVIWGWVKTY